MTDTDIRALLESLLARPGNSPEFTHELESYIEDFDNGDLDGADRKYIGDVAKRLGVIAGGGGKPKRKPAQKPAPADTRFDRAKAAFADLFDPDNLDPEAPNAALRREIYEEFVAELERIEEEG